jgi:hypothetical protein
MCCVPWGSQDCYPPSPPPAALPTSASGPGALALVPAADLRVLHRLGVATVYPPLAAALATVVQAVRVQLATVPGLTMLSHLW